MLNNQILVTEDSLRACARRKADGVIDAAELTDDEWSELCVRNINSTRARLVKCGFCWVDHRVTQWMKTFNRLGTRVISHQAGEALDHPYQSVETPRHRAYKERVYLFGDREGLDPWKEAPASDGRTIADTLLRGAIDLAYEHQHSRFKAGYGLTERIHRTEGAGRVPMFHTDQDHVFNAQQAPILRTDGDVPLEWIADLNRRLIITGGLREIIVFTCDVRNGVWCPKSRISGCGKTHARTEPLRGVTLDEALGRGVMGEFRYIFDAQVTKLPRSFWTDRKSYDRYTSALGGDGNLAPLEGAPVDAAKTRTGIRNGHSRGKEAELEAMRAQAFDLTALATLAPGQLVHPTCPLCGRPVEQGLRHECVRFVERPGPGFCGRWLGADGRYCAVTEGVRHYLPGHRCPAHTPAALMGIPEPEPGPGWPRLRKVVGQ